MNNSKSLGKRRMQSKLLQEEVDDENSENKELTKRVIACETSTMDVLSKLIMLARKCHTDSVATHAIAVIVFETDTEEKADLAEKVSHLIRRVSRRYS